MAYTISTKGSARKAIDKIPQRKARKRVEDAIEDLAEEPRPPNSKKLQGKHSIYRRIDVGGVGVEYRIVYEVRDDERAVVVARVGPREGIYEILKRLG